MSETYLLFVAMVVLTVASPGPGVLMTLDNAAHHGWWVAMHGVVGLALGAAVMAGLSSAGVGLLIRSSETLFLTLKYCGVGYLFFLAYRAWHRLPNQQLAAPQTVIAIEHCWGWVAKGALLQTSNPKSLLFFLSVLPQFAGGGLSVAIGTYCVALLLIHAIYAGVAAKARRWLGQPQASRLLSRLSALVFLVFGFTMMA